VFFGEPPITVYLANVHSSIISERRRQAPCGDASTATGFARHLDELAAYPAGKPVWIGINFSPMKLIERRHMSPKENGG
jgi:hypothetical protein